MSCRPASNDGKPFSSEDGDKKKKKEKPKRILFLILSPVEYL